MDEVRTALPGGYSPPDREEKVAGGRTVSIWQFSNGMELWASWHGQSTFYACIGIITYVDATLFRP